MAYIIILYKDIMTLAHYLQTFEQNVFLILGNLVLFRKKKIIRLIVKVMVQLPLIKFLNQIRAKVGMNGSHIKLDGTRRCNGDEVTCFQVENTGSV